MNVAGTGDRVAQGARTGRSSARLVLGTRLRVLREAAGIATEDAGSAIRGSRSKISRLELGRTGSKTRDIEDLLTLYGVDDEAERATIFELARVANADGWWQEYADVVPGWLEQYLDMERAARLVRAYEVRYIPGLLQTGDYARALLRFLYPKATEAEVGRRVELRLRRQEILAGENPTSLWAMLDEAALLRPVGGTAVMRGQIAHLIEISGRPHVSVQVLPFTVGGHPAGGGGFTMLRFSESELPDVVYLEQMRTAVYLSGPDHSAHYRDVLNRLTTQAGSIGATRATLERVLAATT
ncbi:MAG: helix-turn-helix domain-containing protein [Trebonia sp.]